MLHTAVCALLLLPAVDPPCLPPVVLTDLNAFPPPGVVARQCQIGRAYAKMLRDRWDKDPGNKELQQLTGEAELLATSWHDLAEAQDPTSAARLTMLEILRDRHGAKAYYAGRLPPPVPARLINGLFRVR